ncbi:MAG: type 2 isopentenyl-diphosphate Delta-isomerase [Candidatus ainarchaeum sp.]|nr:type 2 isopentenyl-diphosphate Delta-isomerase [Candidatus ainarchaeum sp.]
MNPTTRRKGSHIDVCIGEGVEALEKGAGFGDVEFVHEALPELDYGSVDLGVTLLGKKLKAPLLVEGITGGYPKAAEINRALAEAAQENGVGMGLGSQRAMLEDASLAGTYKVRDVAPKILLVGNIGVAQLKKYDARKIARAVSDVGADAVAVHLNVLQELAQPEGDRDFSGSLALIERLCGESGVPVVAKETGAGIGPGTARRLEKAGVAAIDVAGAGGTSWAGVELVRAGKGHEKAFWDWGIPTAVSTALVARDAKVPVICSGGVRSGVHAAKGIALGASAAGAALPFLRAWGEGGKGRVSSLLRGWAEELRMAMALTGCENVAALRSSRLIVTGRTADALCAFGCFPASFATRERKRPRA